MTTLAKQRLLIIAPHPDDEVIGAGGLIKRVKDDGGKVYVLYLTVGDTRDFSKRGKSTGQQRQKEIEKVAKFLKFDNYHLRLDLLGQKAIMEAIERESPVSIEKIKPTIVTFPSNHSYNQDHRIAALAANAALRPAPNHNKHFVPTIISYEEPADAWTSHQQAKINYFVTLTKQELAAKIHALKLYKSQTRPFPSLRSALVLQTLATLRGAQCAADLAEGFSIQRIML